MKHRQFRNCPTSIGGTRLQIKSAAGLKGPTPGATKGRLSDGIGKTSGSFFHVDGRVSGIHEHEVVGPRRAGGKVTRAPANIRRDDQRTKGKRGQIYNR
jgi:hypothetical protein